MNNPDDSILLDIALPNATTWFYMSFGLAVAFYFNFKRPFSLRNIDLLMLFLMVPPLLYLRDARAESSLGEIQIHQKLAAGAVSQSATNVFNTQSIAPIGLLSADIALQKPALDEAHSALWFTYLWLLLSGSYWVLRAIGDFALVRRPMPDTNFSPGGAAWLSIALLAALAYQALFVTDVTENNRGKPSLAVQQATEISIAASSRVNERLEQRFQFDPARWGPAILALCCHVIVFLSLLVFSWRHLRSPSTGIAAGSLYVLLPYSALGFTDLQSCLPAAMMILGLCCFRMPTFAGFIMGLATGISYFPLLLAPLWIGFLGRNGAARFLVTFVLTTTLILMGLIYGLPDEGRADAQAALNAAGWQAWNPSAVPEVEGLWTGRQAHSAYRLPIFIAHMVLVVVATFLPYPKNVAHLIAFTALITLGVQFWYADHGGVYILWYLPFLTLLIFRPNCSEIRAARIDPQSDWLSRVIRKMKQQRRGDGEVSVQLPARMRKVS